HRIMTDAAQELAGLATAAIERLGPLPIGLVGGVFTSPIVTATVASVIGDTMPGRHPVEAAAALATLGQQAADDLGYHAPTERPTR
ncbi:MAG TPA: hypothetical protein PLV68_12945, partial [Ilumatobacteraceae bacterium]|nr:hypothetical protein [Ilumatobacteraceae bacterium]